MNAKVYYTPEWKSWCITFYDGDTGYLFNDSAYAHLKKDCIEYGKEVLQKNADGGKLEIYDKQNNLQKVVEF